MKDDKKDNNTKINIENNPNKNGNLNDNENEKSFEEKTDPDKKPKTFYLETREESKNDYQIVKTLTPPKEMRESNNYGSDIDCFCLRWEKNDPIIAAGYSNGYMAFFNSQTGACQKYIKVSEYPVTSLRWKPYLGTKPKNILATVTADGKIDFFHSSSGKILYSLVEEANPIMCLDFNVDGSLFVTGGNDKVVKLYDDNMKTLVCTMKTNSFSNPGHSNRIFSVIFSKESENLLISGGWDNTLQLYDVREKAIVNSIYGPHICGDAIDIKGNKILTASWLSENQIQIFDLRMLKAEAVVNWASVEGADKKASFLYTCQFAKFRNDNYQFAIGGSSENIFSVLNYEKIQNKNTSEDYNEKNNNNYDNFHVDKNFRKEKFLYDVKMEMISHNLPKSVYTIDYAYKDRLFAVGCGDGNIHIVDYKEK